MAKPSWLKYTGKYIPKEQIQSMTYNQLARAVSSGAISAKRLKQYYVGARKTAMARTKRVSATTDFGDIQKEYFTKTKNLVTESKLLHEIADVNRYLNSKRSTVEGLKQLRAERLNTLEAHGFSFVNESNYGAWVAFMQWFQSSSFSAFFDSTDDELEEVFSEGSGPEEWEKLFKAVMGGFNGYKGDKEY